MEAPSSHNGVGIFRSKRNLPPADYLFKIKSYSLLMNAAMEKYESNVFPAGGCKWKLVLYPRGNLKSKGSHVSLYLAIADPEKISHGGKVNVNFKLFVFDQKNENYLTIQDGGNVRTFSEEKTEWGFEKLVLLKDLFDQSNGYYVKDSCVFGAEVFVIGGHSAKSESLSMLKHPTCDSFKWKLEKYSTLGSLSYDSQTFADGERDWILKVYPRGSDNATKDKYLSLYLELEDCLPNRTVYATYTLKILDQHHNTYHQKTGSAWFRPSAAASKLAEASANKLHEVTAATNNLVGASTRKLIGDSATNNLLGASAATGTFMGAIASKWLGGESAAANKLKGASAAVNNWFGSHAMGFAEFISLSELNKEGNGYVKKNAIIIEVDIQISMIKISS